MRHSSPSPFIALTLMATQLLGPAALWAAEQRGIRVDVNRQIIVSALSGNQLAADTKTLQFRETVDEGAILTTGTGTTAELLIGNRAVVTLGSETTAQVRTVSTDQTTIQVTKGMVRVAAAASAVGPQGLVTVQTPTSQVQTRGGILRVTVDAPMSKAEHHPTGAQAYRASYSTGPIVAAITPSSDIIHVEEGMAEILGVGPNGGLVTMKAGQRVAVQAGHTGSLAEAVSQKATTGILATTGHTLTPKEGRDYLVALQVDQATKLGQALTGAAETGTRESGQKSDTKNVINGATGGVQLQAQGAGQGSGTGQGPGSGSGQGPGPGGVGNPFGTGGFFSGTGGTTVSNSGSGTLDDLNGDQFNALGVVELSTLRVKGGAGLLLFTDRPKATDDMFDPLQPGKFLGGGAKLSKFSVSKELLLVDGGALSEAAHAGKAPISTLVARAIVQGNPNYGESPKGDNTSLPLHWFLNGTDSTGESKNVEDDPENVKVVVVRAKTENADRPIVDTKAVVNIKLDDKGRYSGDFTSDGLDTSTCQDADSCDAYGTKESILGDFSSRVDGKPHIVSDSYVDGVISARSAPTGNRLVTLAGGAVLDKQTTVTLGKTAATDAYFTSKTGLNSLDATKFTGSLLAVLASKDGGFNPAFVKVQDRLLGVLGGSSITEKAGAKTALLSILDSRVTGPDANDPSTGSNGRKPREIAPVMEFDGSGQANRTTTTATVTSAVVVRATDVPLDGALLSASSPLLAMMQATLTTKSHFADLAGNNGKPALLASLVPGDALVRLDNAALRVNGNLLNLNNATAAVTGYLFSLTNSSALNIQEGSLFSLNGNSSLTLNGNAFGVFGSGTNTLTINNDLCGAGAACGALVNSAGQAITLQDGTALQVAGVTQNVVLPDGFSVFALQSPNAPLPQPKIGADDALFQIDATSTLTINVPTAK